MSVRIRPAQATTRWSSAARRSRATIEALEERRLLAHFAVIGDFSAGQPLADVATEIKSWNPDFIATVGDNYYDNDASLDDTVGNYFHGYVSPYNGVHGAGSANGNQFWPALGNHDYDNGLSNYTSFFTLPGNERYYSVTEGNVALFIVNSNTQEPDGTSSTSTQAMWLKSALAASTAQWKLVLFHHPAYSSGSMGSNTYMQWPFQAWGASAVISGHDHDYERLIENGFPYFVDGLGGASIVGFGNTVAGSQVRYDGDYGAMLIDTSSTAMTFQFINRSGQVIDTYSLTATTQSPPTAPVGLIAAAEASTQAKLTWTDSSPSLTSSFEIDRSDDGGKTFNAIGNTLEAVTTFLDSGLAPGGSFSYRVIALNSGGSSSPSATSTVTLPSGSSTFISDMTWVSSTNGWGPVERDMSVGGSNAGDGNTITLNGVPYPKGLGAHADSSVVVNLNKQYSTFVSDVGVDDETGPGTVDFQVFGDGTLIYDSGVMTQTSATKSINVDVSNVTQLDLVVTDTGDGIDYDHADWADAHLQSAAPSQPPAAPTNLIATALSPTQINVTWNDVQNESGYTVQRSTDNVNFTAIGNTSANVTSYTDSTVSGDTLYYYRVIASNASGASPPSNVDFARPAQPPSAPSNLAASVVSSGEIDLAWQSNDTNDEESFKIERSTDNITFTQIGTVPEETDYQDMTVQPGTIYYYRVRASNNAGDSGPSNVVTATTPASATALPSPWVDGDIGAVSVAGSAAYTNGVYTIKGSGSDIWNSADGFNFVYVPITGNASITAKVTSMNNTNAWAKAGVMIRESLAAGAREASMVITPTSGSVFLYRTSTNGSSDGDFSNSGVAPYWVRLTRSGTSFTAAISTNGTTWTTVGTQTVAMGTTAYIGLVVCSKASTLNTATFANVSSTGTPTVPAAPTGLTATPISGTQINLAWTDVTGETGYKIERSTDNVTFTQIGTTAAGVVTYPDTTVSGTTTYYYRVKATNAVGDSPPSSVVSTQPLSAPNAPSGLAASAASSSQINLTWTDNSNNETGFLIERSPDGSTNWTTLTTTTANATSYSDSNGLSPLTQYFYRVTAVNAIGNSNSITANATTLQVAPPNAPTNLVATAATTSLQVGLTWQDNSNNETGFLVERSPDGSTNWTTLTTTVGNVTSYSDTTNLVAGTQYFYRVTAMGAGGPSAPTAVANTTTGTAPTAASNALATASTTALSITITWQDHSSNEGGFLIERSLDGSTNWTSLTTTAPNAITYTDSNGLVAGTQYFYRVTATNTIGSAAPSNVTNATTTTAPVAPSGLAASAASSSQINLTWKDNSTNETGFIIERSTDQNTWTQIATPIAGSTSYSDSTGLLPLTTYYYRVRATNGAGQSTNTTASTTTLASNGLPSPLVDADIGTTGATGSATYSSGVYTVKGAGTDVWNTADSFNFVYQQMTGNCTIIARVASMQNSANWAKAGIMIRNTLATNSAEVSNFMTPTDGVAIINRNTAGASSSLTNPSGSAPMWLKIVRSSNTFTTYSSTNGTTWTKTASFTVTMNSTVYVGLAVCSKVPGTLNTATFDNVSMTSP